MTIQVSVGQEAPATKGPKKRPASESEGLSDETRAEIAAT